MVSYWQLITALTAETKDNLHNYIVERTARESAFFKLAEDDLTVFRTAFLDNWRAMKDVPDAEFRAAYRSWGDGTDYQCLVDLADGGGAGGNPRLRP